MLLILEQLHCSCQAVGKTDILLQFRVIGNPLLVFPVTKLIDMVKAMGSKISSMETIVALLENYKNVYIGFEFSRQAGENAK